MAITADAIIEAYDDLKNVIIKTPTIAAPGLSLATGHDLVCGREATRTLARRSTSPWLGPGISSTYATGRGPAAAACAICAACRAPTNGDTTTDNKQGVRL